MGAGLCERVVSCGGLCAQRLVSWGRACAQRVVLWGPALRAARCGTGAGWHVSGTVFFFGDFFLLSFTKTYMLAGLL